MVELRRSGRARAAPVATLLADVRCAPCLSAPSSVGSTSVATSTKSGRHLHAPEPARTRRTPVTLTSRWHPSAHARCAHASAAHNAAARCWRITAQHGLTGAIPPIRRQALRLPVARRPLVPQLRARKRTDYSVRRNDSFPPRPSLSKSRPPPRSLWPDAAHGHNTGVVKSSAGDLTTAAAEFSERYAADAAQGTAELLSLILKVRALRERVMTSRSTRTLRVYPLSLRVCQRAACALTRVASVCLRPFSAAEHRRFRSRRRLCARKARMTWRLRWPRRWRTARCVKHLHAARA